MLSLSWVPSHQPLLVQCRILTQLSNPKGKRQQRQLHVYFKHHETGPGTTAACVHVQSWGQFESNMGSNYKLNKQFFNSHMYRTFITKILIHLKITFESFFFFFRYFKVIIETPKCPKIFCVGTITQEELILYVLVTILGEITKTVVL